MYVVKEQLGRYETIDTLAEGAMGTVLLARDRLLDRLVAVKTIKLQNITDVDERQRLQRALLSEAQVVQLLAHPNIVTVHDVVAESADEPPSLVMEYVQGSTLEAFLKGGKPLPIDFVLPIATQVALALEHAHTMGVVHGDIKPSNILISDDTEQAKIVDFGIARLMQDGDVNNERLLGTPRYVSPELILGQDSDQRSDLFSLGVVLYEMLTGRSPFSGKTSEEVTQQIARGAADLSDSALREVPEPLRPILRKALERDPAGRFQSAREFAKVLEDPQEVEDSDDMVATQDLSALVVPEIPDVELDDTEPPNSDSQPAGHYSTPLQTMAFGRLVRIISLTALLGIVTAFFLYSFAAPDGPPNARFSAQHLERVQLLPLLQESRRQLLAGEPGVAVRILLRAESLAPGNSRIKELREKTEREARGWEADQMRQEELQDLLSESRRALDQGRARRAESIATQALSLDPDHPGALALIDAAQARPTPTKTSPAETNRPKPVRKDAVAVNTKAAPQVDDRQATRATSSSPRPVPKVQPRTEPESGFADLRVDVFSYLSKGVLTVYADQDQVLLQPFRFVQKSGFLRKKKTAGRLETSLQVPAGETEFRIYVSADGQETHSVNLVADLSSGNTHVLRLIIAENGSASAQLN